MEITSALQSEQHLKKELAEKVGQLQEKLAGLQETVTPAPAGDAWEPRVGAAGGAGVLARMGGSGLGLGGRGTDSSPSECGSLLLFAL